MRRISRLLSSLISLWIVSMEGLADGKPAAVIISVELAGVDRSSYAVLRKSGEKEAARLLMQLFDGDAIVLQDSKSRIAIELKSGEERDLFGSNTPYNIVFNEGIGGEAWAMLVELVGVLTNEDQVTPPDNMMSRTPSDEFVMPMAAARENLILNHDEPLWLGWQGGEAPFTVVLEHVGTQKVLGTTAAAEVSIPRESTIPDRFSVAVVDLQGRLLRAKFRVVEKLPELPSNVLNAKSDAVLHRMVKTAWLTGLNEGKWTVEAVQLLRAGVSKDPREIKLLESIVAGWRVGRK